AARVARVDGERDLDRVLRDEAATADRAVRGRDVPEGDRVAQPDGVPDGDAEAARAELVRRPVLEGDEALRRDRLELEDAEARLVVRSEEARLHGLALEGRHDDLARALEVAAEGDDRPLRVPDDAREEHIAREALVLAGVAD